VLAAVRALRLLLVASPLVLSVLAAAARFIILETLLPVDRLAMGLDTQVGQPLAQYTITRPLAVAAPVALE